MESKVITLVFKPRWSKNNVDFSKNIPKMCLYEIKLVQMRWDFFSVKKRRWEIHSEEIRITCV